MPEKRIQPRFDICLDVRWQASATHYSVRIADISEGGCYVDTIVEVNEGETLFLKIRMPDGEWFEVQGIVAHHFPRLGFGVRFVEVSKEQRQRIEGLIEQFNPGQKAQTDAPWHVDTIDISCHEVM